MLASRHAQAQSAEDLRNEILIYILPDLLQFPAREPSAFPPDSLTIPSHALRQAFQRVSAQTIARAFPDFTDADTLRVGDDGEIIKIPQVSRIFRVRFTGITDVDSAIKVLPNIPGVLYAEKHMDAQLFADPSYTNQWHLNNTGQSGGTSGADIKAEQAWSIFTGSSSIKIGVFDSGVELSHEEFTGKASGDSRSASGSEPGWSHGTHVAGIAAAKANNDKGGRGVDWNAQIDSRKIFDGYGGYLGDQTVYNKIISASDNGVHVQNHSWGSSSYSTTVRLAFAYAYKMNRVSVVAMGNDYGNVIKYPAAFGQGIIAVGATTDDDERSPFSNYGNHIDVTAPGGLHVWPDNDEVDIWSTWGGNSYRYVAGTSMATPQVSGIASLLKGYNSNLYNDDLEQIIRLGVVDKGPTGFDNEYGTGRVNARKALDRLRSPYSINYASTSSGTDYSSTGTYTATFYSTPGLADGVYLVKRHEVRKAISFSYTFQGTPATWGRGVATNGYSLENPNFGMGFSEPVSGTITSTGATFRTYVYEVWNLAGQWVGWKPTTPSGVTFAYTVNGIINPPAVTITGPTSLGKKQQGTWTANPSGGNGSYTYEWRYRFNGTGAWSGVVGTSQTYTRTMGSTDFELQAKVTSQGLIAYDTHYVNYNSHPSAPLLSVVDTPIPENFFLSPNFPNPFNPETEIRFGLPEEAHVQVVIFDLLGREARKLADKYLAAGYHSVVWDGRDNSGQTVASGVYLYQMSAGNFREVKKLTLVR